MMIRNDLAALLRRWHKDRRGAIAISAALFMSLCVISAAFAVDLGGLYLEKRRAQAATDLAAMAAAAIPASADAVARDTLARNGMGDATALTVTPGRYIADTGIPVAERFTPNQTPRNAARVSMRKQGELVFASFFTDKTFDIATEAVAVSTAQATISIGSRLLRLDDGILNALFSAMLGGDVSLSAADYRALLDADVSLFDFANALATELDVTSGTYSDVLTGQASMGNVIDALVTVTGNNGASAASQALTALSAGSGATGVSVPLSGALDLGPLAGLSVGQSSPGLNAAVSAFRMLSATAAIADGSNQVSLNVTNGLPGLATISVDLAMGAPQDGAWIAVGGPGTTVRTSQARLQLVATVGASSILPGLSVRVPLYIEIAPAEARITDLACGSDPSSDAYVNIAARPGIVRLEVGEVTPEELADPDDSPSPRPGRLIEVPLLRVTGDASVEVAEVEETALNFDWQDIASGAPKTVTTGDFTRSLTGTLLGDLNIRVEVLGGLLPINADKALRSTASLIARTAPAMDQLLDTLLTALGVNLGEADVWAHDIRCDRSVLVQ